MDLIALRIFCDLVETQSFTRTAERSFVSQSAVSQRLRQLELQYGQVLIERGKGKGRAAVTEAGRVLYEGAKDLLGAAAELDARVRGLSHEASGTVRVATVYSVGLHAIPARLKPFLAAYPRVNVHLEYSQTGKVYQDVLASAVDVGIVACPEERPGIEVIPFANEPMVLICAPEHPLAREREVPLRALEGQPFVAFAHEIPTRTLTDERLWAAGVKPEVITAYDNIETIKNLVEIGSGVALVPVNTARREARDGTLAIVPLTPEDAFLRPAGLLLKRNRTRRAAVNVFVEAMGRAEEQAPSGYGPRTNNAERIDSSGAQGSSA